MTDTGSGDERRGLPVAACTKGCRAAKSWGFERATCNRLTPSGSSARKHGGPIGRRTLASAWETGHVPQMTSSDLLQRITIDPQICHGKPCVRGLRYPVEFILELLSGGMTAEQVLADYPDLEADDLRAMYAYAARLSRVQRVEPVAV